MPTNANLGCQPANRTEGGIAKYAKHSSTSGRPQNAASTSDKAQIRLFLLFWGCSIPKIKMWKKFAGTLYLKTWIWSQTDICFYLNFPFLSWLVPDLATGGEGIWFERNKFISLVRQFGRVPPYLILVNVRIAHLSIAHWGAILRWAILSLSVIRIAHPNYDTIFHPACFIKGGGYRFWVVLYVFVRFCQETAHNVAQRQNH